MRISTVSLAAAILLAAVLSGRALCCPTRHAVRAFTVQGDRLVETPGRSTPDGSGTPGLTGRVWHWRQTLMNNDERFVPEDPSRYTLEFLSDGKLAVRADCNRVSGSYVLDGKSIRVSPGPSTLAACGEGSLGDRFTANLGAAAIWFFKGGDLYIDLMFDSGTMRFSPAEGGQ